MSIESACRKHLLATANAYARARSLALATVSRQFHGTDSFLHDFKAGRCSITLWKYDEMIAALKANWPKKTARPRPPKNLRIG